jgi:hypothetical protein
MTITLTMTQANQTVTTSLAKFVEITYSTASCTPDQMKVGIHFNCNQRYIAQPRGNKGT